MDAPAFQLDPRQGVAPATREAAQAQLDYAIAVLAAGRGEAVHEARKACKRVRALLRLIRPFLGERYRVENRRLRDAGRALSAGRDAAVLVQTADALFGPDDALEPLAERLRERMPAVSGTALRRAQRLLRIERRRTEHWPLRGLSAGDLVAGLLAGYHRSRREFRHARRKRRPEVLHEWRKQVKYHRYQSELMRPLWPGAGARAHRLNKLSDVLGSHHDLHVLEGHLGAEGARLASRPLLRRARRRVRDAQRACEKKALALGARLFDDRPIEWLGAAR